MTLIPRIFSFFFLAFVLTIITYGQRFAIIGDYGLDGPDEAAVANMVKGWEPDFIITLGDNNYPYGEDSTIDINVGKHYHSFIAPYRGDYGEGATENRFFPTLGNHDDYTENGRPYLDYFDLPGNERYYDFVKGDIHFFALNSNTSEPDGVHGASVQALWLKERLESSSSPWKLIYFHHPPYSTADHGDIEYMQWPFAEWGADVVLSGHDHVYERLEVDGVTYLINGLGGNESYDFKDESEYPHKVMSKYNSGMGAMLATVEEDGLHFEFHSITDGLIEEFTLENRKKTGLFDTHEVMNVIIEAPMNKLLKDRGDTDRDYHKARVSVSDQHSSMTFDAALKVRGNFRRFRENCAFTPFWLKFDKEDVQNTPFQRHRRLKVVNPCIVSEDYDQYVMQEYLGYRMYNFLTDSSFRVRPLNIKYIDTGTGDTVHTFSFFIENDESLGKRLKAQELQTIPDYEHTPDYGNPPTMELFQFMIGNDDWGIPDHNVKIFRLQKTDQHVVVPYDFDLSHLVGAPYGFPEDRRPFRGFCRTEEEFRQAFLLFDRTRPRIEGLYNGFTFLDVGKKEKALKVIGQFFRVIDHPERRQKEILDRCGDDF